MKSNSDKNKKHISDLLEKCPWCQGELEAGRIQSDNHSIRWFSMTDSAFKRFWGFTGKNIGRKHFGQRCLECKKYLLVKKED